MTTVYDEYPLLTFKTEQEVGCFMRFEQLNEGVWAMTYLIVDEETQQAALVDPVYDFLETYLSLIKDCLLYTSPSPRDAHETRMPSSA